MARSSFYTVTFVAVETGDTVISRTFQQVRNARAWAANLAAKAWAREVIIWRGGPGTARVQ